MKEPKFTCELCCETYDLDTLIPFDDRLLQRSKNLPKTHIGTDSYVAVQLLEKQNALNFNSLRKVAEQVQGTFSAEAAIFRKESERFAVYICVMIYHRLISLQAPVRRPLRGGLAQHGSVLRPAPELRHNNKRKKGHLTTTRQPMLTAHLRCGVKSSPSRSISCSNTPVTD